MSDKTFVHVHVHTEFSLLDGLSRIGRLVSRAKELDMPALAITDHGTMFGVMDFYNACIEAEIKPIIGVEAYLSRRGMQDRDAKLDRRPYHMLLMAKNRAGYQNLLKISSAAQLNGYYYRPRIDMDFLAEHSEGLIATTGCLAAKIPSMLMAGQDDLARQTIGEFVDIFGEDNFYLEVQQHDIPEIHPVNKWLVDYNRENHTNVGLLATNDVHYVNKDDFDAHDTLLCIQTSALKSETNRLSLSDNSYYLSSTEEMWDYFGEIPEAIYNTQKIADMCDLNLDRDGYHLPIFPVPDGHDAESYLRHLTDIGLDWRYGSRKNDEIFRQRLDRELGIIHNMGFETYFLIVWDLCEFARKKDIWWNVRGSGAGSLVAYSLGITNIDPIQNNLLFERFLNPGRVSMPDIDLDYPDDRRGEMIAYSANKYGEDKVAAIITFGTLGAKAAVRDVGRAMDVPLPDVNRAASLIPQEAKQKPLGVYVDTIPELKQVYNSDPKLKQVIDTAKLLQGVNRHSSTHAAGVIIGDKPLVEYLPLHRLTGKDPSGGSLKAVTQFPMETCESIGLLKVDFLGLSTLTILRKACDLIEQYHGISYTMDNIPYRHDDDRLSDKDRADLDKAFELMGRGDTVGVFQVESSGMQQMLRGMRPHKFEHIIAAVSLYRPGPMDFIPQYNDRLHGKEAVQYHHPKLEPILKETFSIIIYQEQIMQIAGQLFGYDLGEADLMRKAVSKKKAKELKKHKDIFMTRGPENDITPEISEKIFDEIEFFANYGFNKSHASDYAVITVQTAFLKTHYTEEYMTALLTVQRSDSAKVSHFLEECRRLDIPILPPDINHSMADFAIQPDVATGKRGIRFGVVAIKNAGEKALEFIINEREENGLFKDLDDFCRRVDLRKVGKRTLESLVKVGAMRDFGKRSQLYHALERIIGFSGNIHKDKEVGQMNMFGESADLGAEMLQNLPDMQEYSDREMLDWEKELLGLYVTGRPVDKYRQELSRTNSAIVQDLKQNADSYREKQVGVAGEIVELRKIYTKNNDAMAVVKLEDWHDSAAIIEAVLFPRTWTKVVAQLESEDLTTFDEGSVVLLSGKFDDSRGDPQIIVESVTQNFNVMDKDGEADAPIYEDAMPEWANTPPATSSEEPPPWDEDDTIYDEETGELVKAIATPEPEAVNGVAPATQGAIAYPTPAVEPQAMPTNGTPLANDDPEWTHKPDGIQIDPLDEEQQSTPERWMQVYFPRSGDDNKDRRRLMRLHGILTQYPGNDRFTIIVEGRDRKEKSTLLEFPTDTTNYCDDLLQDLLSVVNDLNNIELFDRSQSEAG